MKSRRHFLKAATASATLIPLSALSNEPSKHDFKKKKIVCVGAHPDDPESGCGGTLAQFAKNGHAVTVIYLTTGEAGINGKNHAEAATIRKQEATNACLVLQAKPIFAGQVDGDTMVNKFWQQKIDKLIEDEKPDIVFTHWPLDTHADHQAASLLTMQAWVKAKQSFSLYFFEVCAGEQTMIFHPTDHVDITATQDIKRKAVYCHQSQDPPGIYNCGHAAMEDFRGRELGVKAAEAFIRMNGKKQGSFKDLLA